MLSKNWTDRKPAYDFVVVGSGYGGAITAARFATAAGVAPKPTVCILERGKEWQVGEFPDQLPAVLAQRRTFWNPLGLYEFESYGGEISVIKGSGLGGTSLINANVAITPDRAVFEQVDWPARMSYAEMLPWYVKAADMLGAGPYKGKAPLAKLEALRKRAAELGLKADLLPIAVNFDVNGNNRFGVPQTPCCDCGDCVTGCNFGAKNTLYMNYLPLAHAAGAEIFTRTKVEWIEKQTDGGWRVHGRYYHNSLINETFSLEARNVVLAAGAINTTEILLRSEMRGLSLSPAVGTRFSGNGDFFGLAYNSDHQTDVLGYGRRTPVSGASRAPGPSIVGGIRYNPTAPLGQRLTIEDFSFPSAYVAEAKLLFASIRGEDTDSGDEAAERARLITDLNPAARYAAHGALNHTMLYLVMGQDDARGSILLETPVGEPDGRVRIRWEGVGQQPIFAKIDEELRRHARALGASYIVNPTWNIFQLRHLVTAHPLGGCPVGEDYLHGAADDFGRVFSGEGDIHQGLFVADGALVRSAVGVNPFLTISAMAERIAHAKVRNMQGVAYPEPKPAVSFAGLDAISVSDRYESELERIFLRSSNESIDVMLNTDGAPAIDIATQTIRHDAYWKGFFPRGHILNALSSAIFTGFKKRFYKEGLEYKGVTSDTDGRIGARNSLAEVTVLKQTGTLEPGEYILLRYLDAPWTGFYDVLKVINADLLIGRVYLGEYPNGRKQFTFAMTRKRSFSQMTVDDHRVFFSQGRTPTKETLHGAWCMDVISNNNHLARAAYLLFDLKPDGRLESRYRLLGIIEGLVVPSFARDHFHLDDFTPFHDEIRQISDNFMVGRYVSAIQPALALLPGGDSLGVFHRDPQNDQFGFFYMLTRVEKADSAAGGLLAPFLNVQLPGGIGMTFDEEMTGWYFPGLLPAALGGGGDVALGRRIPAAGSPPGARECRFQARMTIDDLNDFVDGAEHEAAISGTIFVGGLEGQALLAATIDPRLSRFNYLRVNTESGEAEMRYHIVFRTESGKLYALRGRKYMQKDEGGGMRGAREVLEDYTTLYCDLWDLTDTVQQRQLGMAWLKFRTFEDLAAVGSLTVFLRSFRVTGTDDPVRKFQAQMRFLAFTGQFVQNEYDPLAPDIGPLNMDVQAAVARGAETPDFFSTLDSSELKRILRDTPTLPLEKLVSTGSVRIDFEKQRIHRDSFWKGSFAKDTLLGWEESVQNSGLSPEPVRAFAGGRFWKRFDRVNGGIARGHVVNYELHLLPGQPEVTVVEYPDDNRSYFRKGDKVLLLKYRNPPYQAVYDTIKIVDEDRAIGVMHVGEFPKGVEVAPFVMTRNNYPFEHMSLEDHALLFAHERAVGPTVSELQGQWEGSLVLIPSTTTTLLNRHRPVGFRLAVEKHAGGLRVACRFGIPTPAGQPVWTDEFIEEASEAAVLHNIRVIGGQTLVGRWTVAPADPALIETLHHWCRPRDGGFHFYYLAKHA